MSKNYVAYDDGNYRLELKCPCSCWYCRCTREGHCGSPQCGKPVYHPEDHSLEENLKRDHVNDF